MLSFIKKSHSLYNLTHQCNYTRLCSTTSTNNKSLVTCNIFVKLQFTTKDLLTQSGMKKSRAKKIISELQSDPIDTFKQIQSELTDDVFLECEFTNFN